MYKDCGIECLLLKTTLVDALRREGNREKMNFQFPGKNNLECKSRYPGIPALSLDALESYVT